MSSHAYNRWLERIQKKMSKHQIADRVYRSLTPKIRKGLEPFHRGGKLYYMFFLGKFADKLVFPVVTPDSSGLWSGWKVVTFLTDDVVDEVSKYMRDLYNPGEVKDNDKHTKSG